MLMKQYQYKKAQQEKQGKPYAIFKVERVGISSKFQDLNKKYDHSLEKTFSYPVYFEFTDDDIPAIQEKVINKAENQLFRDETIGFSLFRDDLFAEFQLYSKQQLDNGVDYEYHVTYDKLSQDENKRFEFGHIKKLKSEDGTKIDDHD